MSTNKQLEEAVRYLARTSGNLNIIDHIAKILSQPEYDFEEHDKKVELSTICISLTKTY